MTDVLLIHPYKFRFPTQLKRIGMPVGMLQLASCLEKEDISVSFIDAAAEGFDNEIMSGFNSPIDQEPILRYGLGIEEILNRIKTIKPKIVGLSSLSSSQFGADEEMGKAIKNVFPDIITITGGYHASACPDDALETFDYVICGEGEIAFTRLIKNILNNNKPKQRIIKGQPVLNLDSLPFPAYHLVDHINYGGEKFHGGVAHNEKIVEIFTTRGCPNNCDFCAVKTVHGRNYRTYSIQYIKNLLSVLKQQGYNEVVIEDDNFMLDKKRASEIMSLLKEYNFEWTEIGGIGVKQLISNDKTDKELIKQMAESGCYRIYLAIESLDKKTLQAVGKQNLYCLPSLAEQVIYQLDSVGIEVYGGFMIGFPHESIHNVQETVNYAAYLKQKGMKYAILFHATPVPGTVFWQKLKKAIVGCQLDYCFERSNFDSSYLSAKTLNKKRRDLLISANGQELADSWESGGTWPT